MQQTKKIGDTNILLESGTNELEIVEFSVNDNVYGMNVAKVREIIRFPEKIVPIPESHPSILGVVELRGKVVPLINLPKHLGVDYEIDNSSAYIIVSEFNKTTVGFCVDKVDRIRRLSWSQIEPPSGVIASEEGLVIAIVKFDNRMILLLDFEKINAEINPETSLQNKSELADENITHVSDRASNTILVAEDSSYIMKIIVSKLEKAGYKVRTALNGLIAWDMLNSIIEHKNYKKITDHVNVVISDIEMPQMDGLHLIKNIKSNPELKQLPCIVFSSMITDEMELKCKSVGADAQTSKPEIEELVSLVDGFVLTTAGNKA